MGMVLQHELTASYAAGSLGGTLGRLKASIKRLVRNQEALRRIAPGAAWTSLTLSNVAFLNLSLRSMYDAWQGSYVSPHRFNKVDDSLTHLKERTVGLLCARVDSQPQDLWSEYLNLAQDLDTLASPEHHQ